MENKTMSTKKAVLVVGSMIVLIGLSLVIPASSVGIKKSKRPKLDLEINGDLVQLQHDADTNGTQDWRDLLNKQMSSTTQEVVKNTKIDEATKKRLDDPNNITASFSKNLYVANAYASQQGNLTEAQQQDLAAKIVDTEAAKLISKIYEITDLHIIKGETDASRKTYINDLGTLYKKSNISKVTSNDIAIMQSFTTNKDASVLKSFVVKKGIIDTIITQLLTVQVPYSAVTYHLLLVNALSQYSSLLDNLSKGGDDPLRAVIAFKSYEQTRKSLNSAIFSLRNYIVSENITFTPSDAGYILVSSGQ